MVGFSPSIEAAIADASLRTGLPADTLRKFVRIESGGDPNNRTGSYRGLLQLSPQEFAKHGGQGDIFDPVQNLVAGAAKLKAESTGFAKQYGREPTASELYLMHQQGTGGAAAHWSNPDAPAWQNMASTAEGRSKGEDWAKQAIWGNVSDKLKAQFGSVDNITSRDFVSLWDQKVNGGASTPAATPVSVVSASIVPSPAAALEPPATIAPPTQTPASGAPAGFSIASLFGGGGAPAASPSIDGFSFGGMSLGPSQPNQLALAGGAASSSAAAAKAAAQTSQASAIGGMQATDTAPVDISKLVAIMQSRSRLGTA